MPNNGSWNGVYAGEQPNNYEWVNVTKKKADELDGKSFFYDFQDGWGARVVVTKAKREKTSGFRYPWMISEIIEEGRIIPRPERIEARKKEEKARL